MTDMESPETESQTQNNNFDDSTESYNGSRSDIVKEKSTGTEGMSGVHDIAFIITICMAQILALAGLGQGLGA
jgi:methylthioribose-1-phosphate isomerase